MIEHGEGFSVRVETPDLFFLIDKGRNSFVSMNRAELTHYRALIDQALNTSVEELGCSKNERLGVLANPDTFGKPTFGVKSAEGMGNA